MTYSYYPGCTLKTKAKELDIYAREAAQALGVTLEEVPDWQCCGAVYPQAQDEIATRLSSVRALYAARQQNHALVTVCSACHHVVKRVNNDMLTNADIRGKANRYLELETPYAGETKVVHYLEMLRDGVTFLEIARKATNPLKGMRLAAYYGCLLLRPSDVMQFDNPENPSIMEDLIVAMGATAVVTPYRNECCGAYVALHNKKLAERKCDMIQAAAIEAGADAIVTACPLCLYNLNAASARHKLPAVYFTELLAQALGIKEQEAQDAAV